MKNLAFIKFEAEMLAFCVSCGYPVHTINVRQKIVSALKDHKAIMDISWSALNTILQIPPCCSQVYECGWDFNEETRNLRSIFQSLVADGPRKPLEDYL